MMWKLLLGIVVVVIVALVFMFQAEAPVSAPITQIQEETIPTTISTDSVPEIPVQQKEPLSINIFPETPIQGEPVKIRLENISDISLIKQIVLDSQLLNIFLYNGELIAFAGFDLKKTPGVYELFVELTDGEILTKDVTLGERKKIEEPLGIPEKLGGNTPESEQILLATLASENAELALVESNPKPLFTESFLWPLQTVEITDEYGYVRKTVNSSIAHKGTDFRAAIGTKVFAANSGVIRISKEYRNYGKTVVIDNGAGILSFYMHLSKINVDVGDTVERGDLIGLSGDTGYAEYPHLHFTIRVNSVSIDPIAFYKLF